MVSGTTLGKTLFADLLNELYSTGLPNSVVWGPPTATDVEQSQ